ncbi:MAG: glycosyltransferase family 4 protein [Anaerolineae bacterium]
MAALPRERPTVALNAQLLSLSQTYRSAGISSYMDNLLRHLPAADAGMDYEVFTHERAWPAPAGMRVRHTRWPTHHPLARIPWEQVVLPWRLYAGRHDLLHALAFVSPLAWRGPTVVTVFDLSFLLFPERFRVYNRLYLSVFTRLSAQRADRVIVISESTKRDAVRLLGLEARRVAVVYCGVDAVYHPLSADAVEEYRRRRGLPERFVLFVGTLEPRKNITGLIEAYRLLAADWPHGPAELPVLVIAGAKGWYYQDVYQAVQRAELMERVVFTGYVPADELPFLYNAATLFVYPSLYEGFGLPPLEAMACGTPVVASDRSSLPEVVGDAGVLVNPTEPAAIAQALRALLLDEEARRALAEKGRRRAAAFSWQRAAQETTAIYRQVLEKERA